MSGVAEPKSAPEGLQAPGVALWRGVLADHPDLDAGQLATLEAACSQRDRLALLNERAASGDVASLRHEREASLAMARLLAALRLPDEDTGKRPQRRGVRGVHRPPVTQADDRPTSLDRARARSERRRA